MSVSVVFAIYCTACRRETMATKFTYGRRRSFVPYLIWQNRCLACGTLYDALPPSEEDLGERGHEVSDLAS